METFYTIKVSIVLLAKIGYLGLLLNITRAKTQKTDKTAK